MPLRILALILVVAVQAAQHTEPGTGYWYEGVVTHGQGKATVKSNDPRPLRQAMEALSKETAGQLTMKILLIQKARDLRGQIRHFWQAIRARSNT